MTRYDIPAMLDAWHMKRAVEIGVDHGDYSYYLLRHSKLDLLWSVDCWTGKWATAIEDAQGLLLEFGDRSCILKMSSRDAASMATDDGDRFDFVYIDASHDTRSVREDMELWLPLISRPGILAGHDYIAFGRNGVIPAVQEVAERDDVPIYLTREKWASWMIFLG